MFGMIQKSPSPAARMQIDAQLSFMSDLSRRVFDSMQKINELNVQVAATLMEESLSNTRQLMSAANPTEALSIIAGQSQPAAEKIRAYQQHVQNIFAETQAGMAKTLESHVPESARTAEAMVREVEQRANEETSKAAQRQKEALDRLATATKPPAERASPGTIVKTAH